MSLFIVIAYTRKKCYCWRGVVSLHRGKFGYMLQFLGRVEDGK
jgi:hypothetical protein